MNTFETFCFGRHFTCHDFITEMIPSIPKCIYSLWAIESYWQDSNTEQCRGFEMSLKFKNKFCYVLAEIISK